MSQIPITKSLGAGKLDLQVGAIHQLTRRIRAYDLYATDGGDLPLVTAGAHIAIPVLLPNGRAETRHYSICSNPGQRKFYQIAVLLEQHENSSSRFIHENFDAGTQLLCDKPKNNFHLHADASPAVLIAGGIGITPLLSMAHTLLNRGRRFYLHYAGRSKSEMAFVEWLSENLSRQVMLYPADENIRMDLMHILADAPGNAHFYVCGPQRLLEATASTASALGIAKDRIQSEHFHAAKYAGDKPVVLELARSNKIIQVNADQSLLNALRDADVAMSFDCCVGDCGRCTVKVLEGEPEHRDHVLSDSAKANGSMCTCVSRARSEKLVLDL